MRNPGSHVLWLEECGADAAPLVGGKAVGLGHLVRQGHRVPNGFAVITVAYREALAAGRPATVGDRLAAEIAAAYRARLGKRIEQALGVAQDVEWAVGPGPAGGRELWLLQARPESVWSRRPRQAVAPLGARRWTGCSATWDGPASRPGRARARLNARHRRQGGPARRRRGPAPHPLGAAGAVRGPQRLAARDPAVAGPARPGHRPAVALGPGRRADLGRLLDRRAAEISALLGRPRSWPEVTRAIFETPHGLAVRPDGVALVADARAAGRRTGLLTSKLVAFLSREVVERSDFLSSFDVLCDESETGVAKPDPRSYEQAAAAMGLDPAGIVFVDDDPANVAGATAAGMVGVHFDVADPAGSFARVRGRLGV